MVVIRMFGDAATLAGKPLARVDQLNELSAVVSALSDEVASLAAGGGGAAVAPTVTEQDIDIALGA